MSKNQYSVAEGHVLRGAEKVAVYDRATGELDFLPGKSNYRAPVVRYLKEQNLPCEVKPDRPPEHSATPSGTARKVGVNADRPAEGDAAPLNPGGVEPGAPQLPAPEPAAPAVSAKDQAAVEAGQGIIVKDGGKPKFYRDRLTPEGWV